MTGHGGHCYDCEGNTEGPHCETCRHGFYRREHDTRCVDCQCNPIGSESVQCDPSGQCRCKPGVDGLKCDRCKPYHFELSIAGCKVCTCNPIGSYDSPPACDPRDGSCRCKMNVEGRDCDLPKPGFFDLAAEHANGAMPCFCYAHSSVCNSSQNYFSNNITATFSNSHRWQSVDARGRRVDLPPLSNNQAVISNGAQADDLWFSAPKQFLGNQLLSYNRDLTFTLRVVPDNNQNSPITPRPSRKDIVIENAQYSLEIYIPIYNGGGSSRTGNQLPTSDAQLFTFTLNQFSGWMPSLTTLDFQRLLTNITSIKIRASYAPNSRAILSSLDLGSAKPYSKKTELDDVYVDQYGQLLRRQLQPALFVEECKCPQGHVGQHCERCAEGYRREPLEGGPFARCVPCNCNQHSVSCDAETGRCQCLHHTNGDNCEKCEEGYYGNPIVRSNGENGNGLSHHYSEAELSNMCKKCPCLNDGPCAEIFNYQLNRVEVVCLACPVGTQGNLCELCDDGYYNAAASGGRKTSAKVCEKCKCNGNIDEKAVGNCDQNTGACRKCVFNTTGVACEKCLPNYWGDALTSVKCHACECFSLGNFKQQINT
jgi:laminin gamma 1